MNKMPLYRFLSLLLMGALIISCSDAWDDHTSLNKDVSSQTLLQFLQSDGRFSQFADLVKEVNLDGELSSTKQMTVFAPDNAAMSNVPAAYLADEESKELFVRHHITYGRVIKDHTGGEHRQRMLSTKWLVFDNDHHTIDDMAISGSSIALKNGFVNVMETPILPRPSIWQYVEEMAPSLKHVEYLNSLTRLTFAPDLSEQIGVDEMSRPVYDSVFVYRNSFNDNIADLSSEDSILTLFLIEDPAFDAEYQKFWQYYKVVNGTTARDTAETNMRITRDYVFDRAYSPGEVPAFIESTFGVSVPFNEGAVVEHFKASNGHVYILSSSPVDVADRIQPLIVEGESPDAYYGMLSERAVAEGYLRIREHASGGYDFVLDNHIAGSSQKLTDGLILPAGFLPSMRYEVYWRAINDFNTSYRYPNDNELRQILGTSAPRDRDAVTGRVTRFAPPVFFSDTIAVTATEYSPNPLDDEVFVGTLNIASMRDVYLQLVPTGEGTNYMAVTVDYIKLVPVFN